jgi:serine/threonine protein kinase
LKCANILISGDDVLKLSDFGVATLLTEDMKTQSFTGTPYWMAPEVISTDGKVTPSSDIWSLGCTIIELLDGFPPNYKHKNQFQAMYDIVNCEMEIPEGVSKEMQDFLKLCFHKKPEE